VVTIKNYIVSKPLHQKDVTHCQLVAVSNVMKFLALLCCMHRMLHKSCNTVAAPLPRHCRSVIFFREIDRIFRLHIQKQQIWLRVASGPRVGPMSRRGNDATAVQHWHGSGATFCACSIRKTNVKILSELH
jgi:hypothetical protein